MRCLHTPCTKKRRNLRAFHLSGFRATSSTNAGFSRIDRLRRYELLRYVLLVILLSICARHPRAFQTDLFSKEELINCWCFLCVYFADWLLCPWCVALLAHADEQEPRLLRGGVFGGLSHVRCQRGWRGGMLGERTAGRASARRVPGRIVARIGPLCVLVASV